MLGRIIRDPKARRGGFRIDTKTGEVIYLGADRLGPVDDSHQPFKYRGKFMGEGPRGRAPLKLRNKWRCEKIWMGSQANDKYYIQECVSTKTGRSKLVATGKTYKALYNKDYRKFRKRMDDGIRAEVAKSCKKNRKSEPAIKACIKQKLPKALSRLERKGYRCRKTRSATCQRYRAGR